MEELPTEPRGLCLQKEFITPDHEAELLHIFQHQLVWPETRNPGAARLSLHYGYTFDYKTFGVDPDIPFRPFPAWLEPLIPIAEGRPPEQVCLQWYPPGAGIPPHVDTHSAYDQLYALSLGSGVVMQFRCPAEEGGGYAGIREEEEKREEKKEEASNAGDAEKKYRKVDVDLPPRSMMQMSGDSRLHWEHGIKKRKNDTLADGTVRPRADRWSITYRWLREGGECECGNAKLCDTAQRRAGIEREYRWKSQQPDGKKQKQDQGSDLVRNEDGKTDGAVAVTKDILPVDHHQNHIRPSPL